MTLRTDWLDGEDVHDDDMNDIGTEVNAKYGPGGTDVPVTDGGTGRSTSTTAYGLLAAGTTATGAHQTLAAGATTDLLVGGGASALPTWTTATGTGAPVRATSPTLVTPVLGTPSSGTLTNCTGLTTSGVAAATLVTASETIAANDNDTTIPTSAAVKAYADSLGAGTVDVVVPGTGIDVDSSDPANPVVSIESGVYIAGGTDVPLADGGTGASLTDPNADRIMFWDDSAGATTWLEVSTGLSITGTTLTATGGGGGGMGALSDDTTPQLGGDLDPNGHLVGAASATDLTKLSLVTSSAAELNILDGVTADAGELNTLDGITATVTELNYTDGVTSAIQTQLDTKYSVGGTDVPVTDGGTGRSTSTTAYGLIAAGTTATGAHQTLAAGATTEILVGGGASALPVWTTAQGSGAPVRATSPTLTTPNIGTPSAGTLTNCTGLPVAGITASTSTAVGVGTVELGHATDTTLSRSSAGVLAVEGVVVDTISASNTLTNKTLTNPTINSYVEGVVAIGTVTSSNTISLTSGTVQTATLTASTACTFTMPTATAGKSFTLMLKQAASTGNGTATFTSVKWPSAGAPTITATAGKMDILSFFSDGTNWYGSYIQGYTP